MIGRRSFATSAALGLADGALATPSAFAANQQATMPYGTFTCSDGRTFAITGMSAPRFPQLVGFMGGKGVVARWVESSASGTIEVLDGIHDGQAIAFSFPPFSGPANHSRRASAPDLSRLDTCVTEGHDAGEFTLTADDVMALGLEPGVEYIGAGVRVEQTFMTKVWIQSTQLAAR
jgi:hypothetical protein